MLKILYICTHNRCRSILSEAITNHLAGDVIEAKSAGSQPAGAVHPLSIHYLERSGIPTDGLRSQSWDEFESFDADVVVTVCDAAAGESCPLWFGKSLKVHWGLSDPSKIEGTEAQKEQAFLNCIEGIKQRVLALQNIAQTITYSDKQQLKDALAKLGAA
ncbi:MAG: arsenate reductase ArsC [Aestuariibacter sp.]